MKLTAPLDNAAVVRSMCWEASEAVRCKAFPEAVEGVTCGRRENKTRDDIDADKASWGKKEDLSNQVERI